MGRVCARGCKVRGRHSVPHPVGFECSGCLLAEAEHGALLCGRCLERLKATLKQAPDLLAHLRALSNPIRAQVFDQDKLSSGKIPFSPAPLNVDLIDAESEVFSVLGWWASYFGDPTEYTDALPSWATPSEVLHVAEWATDYLLLNMQRIGNDALVVTFSRRVLDWPDDPEGWTIAKALARFPLVERGRWGKKPCPACRARTVWVTPPAVVPGVAGYRCKGCGWVPAREELELWAVYFEGVVA